MYFFEFNFALFKLFLIYLKKVLTIMVIDSIVLIVVKSGISIWLKLVKLFY